MLAGLGVNKLRRDADLVRLLADAAFERIVDVQVMADLADVDRLAFVDEGRVARGHREIGKARQHADDVLAHPVAEVAEALVGAQIVERQDGDSWKMGASGMRRRSHESVPAGGRDASEES